MTMMMTMTEALAFVHVGQITISASFLIDCRDPTVASRYVVLHAGYV